ncbi:hypothetical protein, partial [Kaistella sp.]|uniref:hypothetical protein n=1 Tax=Kaistella sp. TaxID=2782235 RepID=UPI002F93244C
MAIREISKDKFYLNDIQKDPMASVLGEEKKWFIDEKENLLGIVILDKIDNDWALVILGKEENDQYRAVDVDASYESLNSAQNSLVDRMSKYEKEDKKTEELYSDNEDETSSILLLDVNDEIKKYLG